MNMTSASVWQQLTQAGREFYWGTPVLDYNAAGSLTAQLLTCSVPVGRKVKAFLNVSASNNNTFNGSYISDPSNADLVPDQNINPFASFGATNAVATPGNAVGQVSCWTNTSAQVRHREIRTQNFYVATLGWLDLADSQ